MSTERTASDPIIMNLRSSWEQVSRKDVRHWLMVAALTIAGTFVGSAISHGDLWIDVRYRVYQKTMNLVRLRGSLYPKRTVLAWIGDDQYWKGELAGRVPLKRDFIARLVDKIAAGDPAAIAIDFDLRSPVPDGSLVEHPDYQREADQLRSVVAHVAQNTPLILPASVDFNDAGDYVRVSSILDPLDFTKLHIREGYLQLPYDKRRVPLGLELASGAQLDSFAEAIVGSVDAIAYRRIHDDHRTDLPFMSYMTEGDFRGQQPADNRIFDAEQLLHTEQAALRQALAHNIVIVSGSWSSLGYRSGPKIDMHPTPAGRQPGSLVHANYVEAILGERTYQPVSEAGAIVVEVLVVWLLAVLLALNISPLSKLLAILGASVALCVVCFVGLQNLGLFFDFFVPLVVLIAHVLVDKVLEWHRLARRNILQPETAHAARQG